ncbi:hypothetical protein Vretimale_7238 [Volvox reticuliferus]|uniref:Uncharacterized protein n=1 Tax=Volvox reticuliferus TaxID=1737510 RepID=A0A8J4LLA3_9CHLO|nr:hypothetical protein Vretimale_7238 [Volvox reticuliferus]
MDRWDGSSNLCNIIEVEVLLVLLVLAFKDDICIVDTNVLWQLAILLQHTRLVRCILHNDVCLLVLVIAQTNQHNVTLSDPNFLAHLATDVAETLLSIDALRLQAAVPKHADHLRILLTILLVDQLTLLLFVLVLSPLAVLTALALVLGHLC